MIESLKSLSWSDYFLYSFTDFREVYRRIKTDGKLPLYLSFLVPLLVSITSVVSMSLAYGATGFFYYKFSYGIFFAFTLEVVQIVIYSLFMDGISQAQGLRGNIREMVAVVNYAHFPKVFILPVMVFFSSLGAGVTLIYMLASVALFFWYLLNLLQGISEMHSIELGRSFGIYILPAVIIGVTGFILILLGGMMAFSYMNSMGI